MSEKGNLSAIDAIVAEVEDICRDGGRIAWSIRPTKTCATTRDQYIEVARTCNVLFKPIIGIATKIKYKPEEAQRAILELSKLLPSVPREIKDYHGFHKVLISAFLTNITEVMEVLRKGGE